MGNAFGKVSMQRSNLCIEVLVKVSNLVFEALVLGQNAVDFLNVMQQDADSFIGSMQAFLCVFREFADLLSDDGKSASGFTGTCSLDGGIQCEQIDL